MLTYELKKSPGVPLYEALYRCIRADILSGKLAPGQKLPSKRALAENLEISKITVESAYAQLLSEGFIRSTEKIGYFVEDGKAAAAPSAPSPQTQCQTDAPRVDLTGSAGELFPFSVWSRLQREVMLDYGEKLLLPLPNTGVFELRDAICAHLCAFRGMNVSPDRILIGAGTDFLYNLLVQLLGQDTVFAIEDPGYGKIGKIYHSGGARCISAQLDSRGVMPHSLADADAVHLSPSHHFPTGLVTPLSRRKELLSWAKNGKKWIIEDDYDSEFRFDAHPMPTLFTLDGGERVIYMNSFSKTLAPSIRIGFMVLPSALMDRFHEKLGFYGCTVPSFEQYTLARFLSRGYFEKHINRMRKHYKQKRNALLSMLSNSHLPCAVTVMEQDAGLHFLLKVDTALDDEALVTRLSNYDVRVHALSHYCHAAPNEEQQHTLVVNYAGVDLDALCDVLRALETQS